MVALIRFILKKTVLEVVYGTLEVDKVEARA